ncbi:hypothetical protein HMH01_14345 [Halovulum dunhuangense]|uniref:DUF4435 domain-containing protein n=1 Tax=Halovulum dunhuangense TaxID=1505036 RepID=A0A849L698_9RHOB|nr:hypothetical protein [Halovulum dunhuangense]
MDLVVYCEGKTVDGEGASTDEIFWERVFSRCGKVVHCKSIGSKSALKELARTIIDEDIDNVVIAMDRDYDDFKGNIIDHRYVIYTFGYSWESDALDSFNFDIVLSLFANTNSSRSLHGDYTQFRAEQSKDLRRIVALDYKYIDHVKPLFNRRKPLSIMLLDQNKEPRINRVALLNSAKQMSSFQSAPLSAYHYKTTCGIQRFFGKFIAKLIYNWFVFRTKSIQNARKPHFEVFMSVALSSIDLTDDKNPRNYYLKSKIAKM